MRYRGTTFPVLGIHGKGLTDPLRPDGRLQQRLEGPIGLGMDFAPHDSLICRPLVITENSICVTGPQASKNPSSLWRMIVSASVIMRSISSWHDGMSEMRPATMPQDQAPASISPSVMMRG